MKRAKSKNQQILEGAVSQIEDYIESRKKLVSREAPTRTHKPPYSVYENTQNVQAYEIADHVLAFCGPEVYLVKTRSGAATGDPPRRPDIALAYHSKPKPRVIELQLFNTRT